MNGTCSVPGLGRWRALDTLNELRAELTRLRRGLPHARVKHDQLHDLDAYGLAARIGTGLMLHTPPTAVGAYPRWRARTGG